jgi:hypothetical protein
LTNSPGWALAADAGSPLGQNMVMLGAASRFLMLDEQDLRELRESKLHHVSRKNVISGNNGYGIFNDGSSTVIQGNYIGTNAAGTAAIANTANAMINNRSFLTSQK